jgi:hypothetical protein
MDGREVGFRVPGKTDLISTPSRPVLAPTQPPIKRIPEALSMKIKRLGREADPITSNVEVKGT